MRGKWLWLSGLIVMAAVGGALAVFWRAGQASRAPAPAGHAPPLPSEVILPGKIQAQHVVPVAAGVEGIVEQFLVEVGQEVYEGQLLARIRNEGLDTAQQVAAADVERAETKLRALESAMIAARLEASRARADASRVRGEFERAERTYLRQQLLYKEGATPRLTFERSEKELAAARLELQAVDELARQAESRLSALLKDIESARRALDEKKQALEESKQSLVAAEIHSPVDGIVVGRTRQAGDPVSPEVRDLIQVGVELSALEVVLEPEPPILARIRTGQPALVDVVEGPPGGMAGEVKAIKGTLVIVEFANPSPAVRPGLQAHVRIKLT